MYWALLAHALVALTVMVTNICLASVLMLFRRRVCIGDESKPPLGPVSPQMGIAALFIGVAALFVVGFVVAWSYLKPSPKPTTSEKAPATTARLFESE